MGLSSLFALPLFLSAISTALAGYCDIVHDEAGNEYDLSPLAGQDYVVEGHNLNGKMYIGVCDNVRREVIGVSDPSKVGVYLSTESAGYSLGSFSTTPLLHTSPLTSLSLSYPHPDGNDCSSLISFICDSSLGLNGIVGTAVPEVYYGGSIAGDCHHVFVFKTEYACPKGKVLQGTGVWGIIAVFLSFVTTAIVVYFVTSLLYRRMVLNLRGKDQFPPFFGPIFWIKDMMVVAAIFIIDKLAAVRDRVFGPPTWGSGRRNNQETGWWNHQHQAQEEGHFSSIRGEDTRDEEEGPRVTPGSDYWGRQSQPPVNDRAQGNESAPKLV